MKTIEATEIRRLDEFTGDARLYELSEPVVYGDGEMTRYVVVSATVAMFSWGEMEGSYRGGMDHSEAIREAGWIPA